MKEVLYLRALFVLYHQNRFVKVKQNVKGIILLLPYDCARACMEFEGNSQCFTKSIFVRRPISSCSKHR